MEEMTMKRTFIRIGYFSMPAVLISGCRHRPVDPSFDRWHHMMDYGGYGMMLAWLVLLIAVAAIVYVLASRRGDETAPPRHEHETPLEILKKRYARGEITREEFDRMKNDIESL
jgi:putative membrane protein